MRNLPATTHQAARDGWRIRVVCKCGRSGEVSPASLLSRPDQQIGDARWRCPREGCGMAREAQLFAPGYVRPPRVNLGAVAYEPPRANPMAKFMQLMNVAVMDTLTKQLREAEAKERSSPAWTRV